MGKKKRTAAVIMLTVAVLLLAYCAPTSRELDHQYWLDTNGFQMVYDMTVPFDEAEGLSFGQMHRISRRRTAMSRWMIKNSTLHGMNADEVRQMLGPDTGPGVYLGGSPYRNTIQYVIDADKRLFQFYGESGHVYKMFVLFLDDSGVVFDARIVNVH